MASGGDKDNAESGIILEDFDCMLVRCLFHPASFRVPRARANDGPPAVPTATLPSSDAEMRALILRALLRESIQGQARQVPHV
jgi:hypothetical protein